MNEPLLKKAMSFEKAFLNDDKMYKEYQQREDAIREETTRFNRVKREAMEQGKAKGKAEEKLENAINALKEGLNVELVAKITNLSIEEVNRLSQKLNK